MNSSHTLQAVFAETHTLVISVPQGGTTNPAPGTYTYDNPTNVSVQAIPSADYFFDHWVCDGVGKGSQNPIIVYVGSSHSLYAVFSVINYTLTIQTTTGGNTSPIPGSYVYASGSFVPVTATPNVNYVLDYWELDGVNVGFANPYSVTMNQNHTLKAFFKFSLVNYVLTITATTGGTTNPAAGTYTYANGTSVNVAATPNTGYQFDHWVLDGSPAGSVSPISVLMTSNHTIQAAFVQVNYQLKIETAAGGTTTPAPGTYTYASGSTVQVTANPSANYTLDHWELEGLNVGSANPYTVTMNQNHTLKAFFKPAPPPLSVTISPHAATIYTTQTAMLTCTVSGGTSPYSYQWYLNGNPAPGVTSVSWTFTPPGGGTYYIYLRVTDANGTTVQSGTSVITVIQPSTGGYSISLAKQTPTSYLVAYGALIALFGATLSIKKRKRK
jgi:hypothetical protein